MRHKINEKILGYIFVCDIILYQEIIMNWYIDELRKYAFFLAVLAVKNIGLLFFSISQSV
jgi:hypothetical protein